MELQKQNFLTSQKVFDEEKAMRNSIKAALQHNVTYKKMVLYKEKVNFRKRFSDEIKIVAIEYTENVSEKDHIANIQRIKENVLKNCKNILYDSNLKIGTVQKALNLYLKFLWCLGKINHEPPHCPIDRIILHKAEINESWTKLDSIDKYINWINQLKKVAAQNKFDSLQSWELNIWNDEKII